MKRAALAGVAVVVVAAITLLALARTGSHGAASASSPVPVSTAVVARTDLATTIQAAGTLGYAGSYELVNQAAGRFITALPAAGRVLARGEIVYEVDGTAIPLFYGPRPMWRDLGAGITPGPDVAQLDDNLIALGFDDGGRLTASDQFTAFTGAAVRAWQRARGIAATGVVSTGDVVCAPGPVRIASVAGAVGAPARPGGVIAQATSTARAVDVELPVAQEYLVHIGDDVTVTLADGRTTTPGVVFAIGTAAATAANPNSPNGSGSGGAGGGPGGDSVDVTVALRDPGAAGTLDVADVTVNIVSARIKGVLAVPINALVALVEGGYAVEVVDSGARRLVPVEPGLFANSLVQVTGSGISAGTRVEVPAS